MRDQEFGRGQNTGVGWSDPTFAHGSVAKVTPGSLQPIGEEQDRVLPARRSCSMQFVMHVVMHSE